MLVVHICVCILQHCYIIFIYLFIYFLFRQEVNFHWSNDFEAK